MALRYASLSRQLTWLQSWRQIAQPARLSSLLIDSKEHGFLRTELGLDTDNAGVYDGSWSGSGEVSLWIFL